MTSEKKISITIRLEPKLRKALRVLTRPEFGRTETAIVELALRRLFTEEPVFADALKNMQKYLLKDLEEIDA